MEGHVDVQSPDPSSAVILEMPTRRLRSLFAGGGTDRAQWPTPRKRRSFKAVGMLKFARRKPSLIRAVRSWLRCAGLARLVCVFRRDVRETWRSIRVAGKKLSHRFPLHKLPSTCMIRGFFESDFDCAQPLAPAIRHSELASTPEKLARKDSALLCATFAIGSFRKVESCNIFFGLNSQRSCFLLLAVSQRLSRAGR